MLVLFIPLSCLLNYNTGGRLVHFTHFLSYGCAKKSPSTQAMGDFKRSPVQFLYVSVENWSIDLVPDLILRRQREGCGFPCINLLKIK